MTTQEVLATTASIGVTSEWMRNASNPDVSDRGRNTATVLELPINATIRSQTFYRVVIIAWTYNSV